MSSDKNKVYSAYKMREDSPRCHNIAVILVIVIALISFSVPTLTKMATPEQREVITEVTTLSQLERPEVKQEEMERMEPVASPLLTPKSSIRFTAPVVRKDEKVRDKGKIRSQTELMETKVAISIAGMKGNDEANSKDIADLKQVMTQASEGEEKVFNMVEQMSMFPGETNGLMKYIVDYSKHPTTVQENSVEGRVICQLAVSSDSGARDAKVVKTLDPYCDKEAIHVVISVPKWIPGEQNGKTVSVKYMAPVVFRLR